MTSTTRTPLQLAGLMIGGLGLAFVFVRAPVAALATLAGAGFAYWWRSRGGKRRLSKAKKLRTVIAGGLALWVAVFVLGYAIEIFGNPTGGDVTAEPPKRNADVMPEEGGLPSAPVAISWMRVDVNKLPLLAAYGFGSTAALWLIVYGWEMSRRRSRRDRRDQTRETPERRTAPNEA